MLAERPARRTQHLAACAEDKPWSCCTSIAPAEKLMAHRRQAGAQHQQREVQLQPSQQPRAAGSAPRPRQPPWCPRGLRRSRPSEPSVHRRRPSPLQVDALVSGARRHGDEMLPASALAHDVRWSAVRVGVPRTRVFLTKVIGGSTSMPIVCCTLLTCIFRGADQLEIKGILEQDWCHSKVINDANARHQCKNGPRAKGKHRFDHNDVVACVVFKYRSHRYDWRPIHDCVENDQEDAERHLDKVDSHCAPTSDVF
mmetsp:Transcript_26160/g.66435  ORF Transcript_26160/g.66435 Transcript_26160/m.66435 type:complete len:255 (-) Transcript_26160:1013-1777(-)